MLFRSDVDENVLKNRAEELKKRNINVKTYIDYTDLLKANDVDVVIVATPDHWHCMQKDVFLSVRTHKSPAFSDPIVLNEPRSGESFHAKDSDGESGLMSIPLFELTDQYSPALVVNPTGKRLFVAWEDRRRSQTGLFFDVYGVEILGRRNGHFKRGENLRLSDQVSIAPGTEVFMGDYISLDWSEAVHLAYTAYNIQDNHPGVLLTKLRRKTQTKLRFANLQL